MALTAGDGTTGPRSAGEAHALTQHPRPAKVATFEPLVATAVGSGVDVFPNPEMVREPAILSSPNRFGVPLVFLVRRSAGAWLQVYLPKRPNGSTGWVRSTQVTVQRNDYEVVASLSRHTVVVSDGFREVLTAVAAVGAPATPTPTGTYFVTELLRQPDPGGPYGPYAYGLSAYSDVLQHFGGGPGQIGVHGTNEPASIGTPATHGCLRVANAVIERLVPLLPLGTPVVIVR